LSVVQPDDQVVAGLLSIDDAAALHDLTGCRVTNVLFAPMLPTVEGDSSILGPLQRTSRLNRVAGALGVAAATGMCTTSGRLLRSSRGLPRTSARRFVQLMSRTPTLLAFSPVLVPPAPDWPRHVVQTGAWLDQETHAGWQPPEDLAAFLASGPPPVFISFGSVPGTEPDVDVIARAAAGRMASRPRIDRPGAVLAVPGGAGVGRRTISVAAAANGRSHPPRRSWDHDRGATCRGAQRCGVDGRRPAILRSPGPCARRRSTTGTS